MHDILQDALDDLVSTRTSTTTKGEALVAIEHVLAETSDPRAEGLPRYFNALQDTFQCNVPSRIIAWTSATTSLLERSLSKGSTDHCQKTEVITLATQLAQGMAIIQGVALVHKASKQFLGRRYPLEVLLNLLLVSRHLNPPTPSASTPTSPRAGASQTSTSTSSSKSTEIPLASIVIDTLLCILVDSIPALRVFEDLNGVQVVVKILKRAGTPREVRMKCLEFLYFYLLDETVPPDAASTASDALLSAPDATPARTPSPLHQSQPSISATSHSGYSTSPSSRSSSSSSAFSVLSTSTAATSASLYDPPPSTNPEPSKLAPKPIGLAPKSVIPGLVPNQRTVTPPTGVAGVLGRGQPRSLLMLKREVDYVPLSPKKPQISHLGRAPSGLRPKLTERSNLVPKMRVSGPGDVLSSEDTEGEESGKSTSTSHGGVRPARSRVGTGISSHARGLSVSSISSVSSASSACSSPPRSDAPQTPARDKAKGKESHTQPLSPSSFETPKASSKLHRRAQSLADFSSSESPSYSPGSSSGSGLSPVKGAGPRSASTPTGGAGLGEKRGPRTMQEKKEILGTMLGNVDALVEGVKKAGVWGLS
ncbi:cell division control protein 14, SIN component-domain-containing protein [Cerioporus squamosus]|nr:cell division control protein 14, SIN component-domain-containing protein [Cerioporus squamosus]